MAPAHPFSELRIASRKSIFLHNLKQFITLEAHCKITYNGTIAKKRLKYLSALGKIKKREGRENNNNNIEAS